MKSSRRQLALVAFYGGLVALLIVCGWELSRSSAAAQAAAENLEQCRRLAAQIENLKSAPAQASLRRQSMEDLAMRIEQAAQLAGIASSAIASIEPQAARRVGKSAHLQYPTRLEVRQVSLAQLTKLLGQLTSGQSGLEATSIRLTVPRTPAATPQGEIWSAEVVLTYLVFSPEYASHSSSTSVQEVPEE